MRKGFTETHAVKPWLKIYGKNFSLPHFWAIGRSTDQSRPAFATSQTGCSQGGKTVNSFSPKFFSRTNIDVGLNNAYKS